MQKDQRRVISILTFLLLITFSCNSQEKNNDYTILKKVIEHTSTSKDSSYNLTKRVNADQSDIQGYYDYRFLNKPFYNLLKGYDEVKDSIIYDSKEEQEKRKVRWDIKCKVLDTLFTKKDLENFIRPHEMLSFWRKDKISNVPIPIMDK